MNKFKVEQRVLVNENDKKREDWAGVIVETDNSDIPYRVVFDNNEESWMRERELQPIGIFKRNQRVKVVPFNKEGTIVSYKTIQGEYKAGVEVSKAKGIKVTPVLKYYPEDTLELMPEEEQPKVRHPHAELMLQYAQDALTMLPEELNINWEVLCEGESTWIPIYESNGLLAPSWRISNKYRRKPKTIRIGNYDVPEPLREAPAVGTTLFIADPTTDEIPTMIYEDGILDWKYINRGLCHTTEEAAELHAKALLSFTTTE